MGTAAQLRRQTFETSRLLDFFTVEELSKEIGHGRQLWDAAILKELIDNGIDAAETAGVLPDIQVVVDADGFAVRDNGPGLPAEVLERSLDYMVRVSDKRYYCAPTRGQQGAALKTVWAAPYLVDGEKGQVQVDANGLHHDVTLTLDRLNQVVIPNLRTEPGFVKNGTLVRVSWPDLPGLQERFVSLLYTYAALNPHTSFSGFLDLPRTADTWRKWLPTDKTSPWWYTPDRLRDLVAAHLRKDTGMTIREFVGEFAGLSGSGKQKEVLLQAGLHGHLRDLVQDGDVALEKVERLLEAMRHHAKPVKAGALGIIGEQHIRLHLVTLEGVSAESFRYKQVVGQAGDLPFVIEAAFGERQGHPAPDPDKDYAEENLELLMGLNFSPTLKSPSHTLTDHLENQRINMSDHVVVMLSLTSPLLSFTDRGKATLTLGEEVSEALETAIEYVGRDWEKLKRHADRTKRKDQIREADRERLRKRVDRKVSLKDAVERVMEKAVELATKQGKYRVTQRNLYYKIRELIQRYTTQKFKQAYCNTLITDWENRRGPIEGLERDPRGYLLEPHGGRVIPLGTSAVDEYHFPEWTFDKVLYIEKKGFLEALRMNQIPEKYDLAIMAAEGYSTRAARTLLAHAKNQAMTIFCLHDCDPDGYAIEQMLREPTKTMPNHRIEVIDIGLRLTEALRRKLPEEEVIREKALPKRLPLTKEERRYFQGERGAFTRRSTGKRIELNAFDIDDLVEYIEVQLQQHGCTKKIVPPVAVLQQAAQSDRDTSLRNMARGAIERHVKVDQWVDELVRDTENLVNLDGLPEMVQQWGETLNAGSWRNYLAGQVSSRAWEISEKLKLLVESRANAPGQAADPAGMEV